MSIEQLLKSRSRQVAHTTEWEPGKQHPGEQISNLVMNRLKRVPGDNPKLVKYAANWLCDLVCTAVPVVDQISTKQNPDFAQDRITEARLTRSDQGWTRSSMIQFLAPFHLRLRSGIIAWYDREDQLVDRVTTLSIPETNAYKGDHYLPNAVTFDHKNRTHGKYSQATIFIHELMKDPCQELFINSAGAIFGEPEDPIVFKEYLLADAFQPANPYEPGAPSPHLMAGLFMDELKAQSTEMLGRAMDLIMTGIPSTWFDGSEE